MVTSPVQLFDSTDRSRHGTRYTGEDREDAYQSWKAGSGRSLRRTSEMTGIAVGTLSTWSREEGWQGRARREDAEDREALARAMRGLGVGAALRAIQRIEKLADNEGGDVPHRVRFEANEWLAGIAGVSPNKPLPIEPEPAAEAEEIEVLTPDEIRRRQRALAGLPPDEDDE